MRSDRGFTIVEVLVAMAIVGICVAMIAYLVQGLNNLRKSTVQTTGVNYARRYIDVLKALWQDQGYYQGLSMPSVAPPKGFTASWFVDGKDCGNVVSTSRCSASITNATSLTSVRKVRIDVTAGGETVSMQTQIAAPFYLGAK